MGDRTIAVGERVEGDVVVFRGDLNVHGVIDGDAVALGGDLVLHPGSTVQGDAVAVGGQARNLGGRVGGELRSLSGFRQAVTSRRPTRTPVQSTGRALSLTVGWFVMLTSIGIVVMLFARDKLETVAGTIQDRFSRALLIGILGELALLPVLVLAIVALAVTLVGILLIPLAVVAYLLAAAGALALGFLSMVHLSGEALLRRRSRDLPSFGAASIRYLLTGLGLYFGLWVLAAAFTWAGPLGGVLRVVAGIVTWVAVTVGLGATLLSRGGTRAPTDTTLAEIAGEDYSWQTPTPVTGVAAARRPTPAPRP